MSRARIAVMVGSRGRGSNMTAIATACRSGELVAEVCLVVSPKAGTPAFAKAHELGLTVAVIEPGSADYCLALLAALEPARADWVCLAGLMTKLPIQVVEAYAGHIVNIHPALLPKFGGKGMYGHHVHEAVLEAGDTESGCTVHFVTAEYDEGEPILQLKCPVLPGDSPEELAARVLELEHKAYPLALKRLIEGDD